MAEVLRLSLVAEATDQASKQLKAVADQAKGLSRQLDAAGAKGKEGAKGLEAFFQRAEKLDQIRNRIMMVEGLVASFTALIPALEDLGKEMDGFHSVLAMHERQIKDYGDAVKQVETAIKDMSRTAAEEARVNIFAQLSLLEPTIDTLRANIRDAADNDAISGAVTIWSRQLNELEGRAKTLHTALKRLDTAAPEILSPEYGPTLEQAGIGGGGGGGRGGRTPQSDAGLMAQRLRGANFAAFTREAQRRTTAEGDYTGGGGILDVVDDEGQGAFALDFKQFAEEDLAKARTEAEAFADAISGAMVPALGEWGSALEGVASALAAVAVGSDTAGEAAIAAAGLVGEGLARQAKDEQAYAAIKAAIETGLGFASLAIGDAAGAQNHFAAAGSLAIAAAMSGLGGGGGGSGRSGPRAANDDRGRQQDRDRGSGGGDRVVVYNISAGVADGQGIVRTIRQSERAAMGTGADRRRGW